MTANNLDSNEADIYLWGVPGLHPDRDINNPTGDVLMISSVPACEYKHITSM